MNIGMLTHGIFGRAVYLDTNIWSELAKDRLSFNTLDPLLEHGSDFLVMSSYQLVELSRRPEFGEQLIQLVSALPVPVCMAARSIRSDLSGHRSWRVGFDYFLTMSGFSPELTITWLEEFTSGIAHREFDAQRQGVIEQWRADIDSFRNQNPSTPPRPWRDHFWGSLNQWLTKRCRMADLPYRQDKLHDNEYYRGAKLHFTVFYLRHYLHPKQWEDSDLVDLLHAFEMGYARVVVTERSMKATLFEARRRLPDIYVPQAYSLRDLRS